MQNENLINKLKTARRPMALALGVLNTRLDHDKVNKNLRAQRDAIAFRVSKIDSHITRLQQVQRPEKREQISNEARLLLSEIKDGS